MNLIFKPMTKKEFFKFAQEIQKIHDKEQEAKKG